jgi:predicted DCC family thiol-disulfide oxidoreductase YuxK
MATRSLPSFEAHCALFEIPAILPVTRFAYDRFADLLLAWNRRKGRC